MIVFCFLTVVPHFLYGPGEDALALTVQYGGQSLNLSTADAIEFENQKKLCSASGRGEPSISRIVRIMVPSLRS